MANKTPLNRNKKKALVILGDGERYYCAAVVFSITKEESRICYILSV